ncbi:MAG: ERCC4 domain-containing protein [Chitinophagaceae bacterium]
MNDIILKIDYRERRSEVPSLLEEMGVSPVYTTLAAGDYLIGERFAVERKTTRDFFQSLYFNRLFDQCRRLHRLHHVPLFILEGDLYNTGSGISKAAIDGGLLSISASWLIPIIRTSSAFETAETIVKLCQLQVNAGKKLPHQFRKHSRTQNELANFIAGIPGLGTTKSRSLLSHFKSVKSLINAPIHEWLKVPGIGPGIANSMEEFVNRPFSNKSGNK